MSIYPLPIPPIPTSAPTGVTELTAALARLRPWGEGDLGRLNKRLLDVRKTVPALFATLADPLSPYLDVETRRRPLLLRSVDEARIARSMTAWDGFDGSADSLQYITLSIQQASLPNYGEFRSSPLFSHEDVAGRCVQFPSPSTFIDQFSAIAAALRDLLPSEPVFAAIAGMTCLAALHPFRDGNGRMSRIFFNRILSRYDAVADYLPIYEIGLFSDGGWILALRRAQRQQDWRRMVEYLTVCAQICAVIQDEADAAE